MLKTEDRASNIMDTVGYWREYPERDLEHVRRYPCIVESVSEEDLWGRIPIAMYIRLLVGNDEDFSSCLANLAAEVNSYAEMPYLADREVRIGFFDGWGCARVGGDQLEAFLESASAFQVAANADFAFRAFPQDLDRAKAEVLARRGFKRVVLGLEAPGKALRDQLSMLKEVGLKEVGVEVGSWGVAVDDSGLRSLLADLRAANADVLAGGFLTRSQTDTLLSAGYTIATYRDFIAGSPCMRSPEHILYYDLDILGLGLGARGFLKGVLYQNSEDAFSYRNALSRGKLPIREAATLTAGQRLRSSTANGLRLLKISRDTFRAVHGFDLSQAFGDKPEKLADEGFLELSEAEVKVTYPKGYHGLETVIRYLLG